MLLKECRNISVPINTVAVGIGQDCVLMEIWTAIRLSDWLIAAQWHFQHNETLVWLKTI